MKNKNLILGWLSIIFFFAGCSKSNDAPIIDPNLGGETIVIPTQSTPEKIIKDVSYGVHPKQKMDVYFPKGYTTTTPIAFVIHGGGFTSGDKSSFELPVTMMMNEGFVVINLNYRLIDDKGLLDNPPLRFDSEIKMADAIDDAHAAVEKVKSMAQEWGLSGSKMYMTGHSAGAQISMLYVQGNKNLDKDIKASGSWGGASSIALPSSGNYTDYLETSDPFVRLYYAELLHRWTGKAPVKENALYYMALSPDWQTSANGGMPNITVMPELNDDYSPLFKVKGTMATVYSATQYHQQLSSKNIRNKFIIIKGEKHSHQVHGDISWYRAVKYSADFFKTL